MAESAASSFPSSDAIDERDALLPLFPAVDFLHPYPFLCGFGGGISVGAGPTFAGGGFFSSFWTSCTPRTIGGPPFVGESWRVG